MSYLVQKFTTWIQKPVYKDQDESLYALYIQSISLLMTISCLIIGLVYVFDGQAFYVFMASLTVFTFGVVIALVRSGKLSIASNLFLIAGLGLLTYGIFSSGGIHSSTAVLYPVLLVFASLLLNRSSFIGYGLLLVACIGFVIYAENRGLTPVPYVPDPPRFTLFITYILIMSTAGVVIRFITESLKNSSLKARRYSQEVLAQKTMLDRVGQAVVGCTLDNTIIYWNQAATNLYGRSEDEVLGRKYYDVVSTGMTPEMEEKIRSALQKGETWNGEMEFQAKKQEKLHVLVTVTSLCNANGEITGWIGIAADLTERRKVEAELHQRDAILESVTFAAEQFLKTPDWRENIDNVLERLGKTINATHAYLFEDHVNSQGEPVTSMRYEWTVPGYPSDLDGPYFQGSPIHQDGFEEQVEGLRRGEARVGTLSSFNPIEKETMQELGVKAILEVPIFVNGREWGAIGFDDFEKEREWSTSEVDALKIAAGILSAAIQRQEVEAAVHESERIYRQAIQTVGAVPYYLDYVEHRYTFMGDGIEEMTGYSPSEITPELWEQMEVQRFPRGRMANLTYEEADRLTEDGTLHHWECDYLIVNRRGEKRWISDTSIQVLDDKNVRIGVVGIAQDITERKLIEANLRKRESILETITFSAEQFLKEPDWRTSIDVVLKRLGMELNTSHAYLFEKHTGANGEALNSIRYEWAAPGQESDLDNPAYQNAPEHETEFNRYYSILNRGEPYVGNSSFFTVEEKAAFDKAGIKAILELRIVVDGRQWGTLGFDDKVNEREWTPTEVDVLKVAANVLGAAIKRQLDEDAIKRELAERKRTELALRLSEEKFSKAFHNSQVLMTIENDKHRFIDANKAFEDVFGVSKAEVIGSNASELEMFYDPKDSRLLQQKYQKENTIKDFEVRFRRKNGEMGVALLSSEKFQVDGAEYTLTSGLDITERKKVEQQIQKHAARAEVLASLSHVLTQVNQDYHLTLNTVVQRCAELIGDGASIFSYSPDNEYLELVAVYNKDADAMQVFWDEIAKHPIKWNEGAYAKAIGENQSVLIPFIDVDKLIAQASPERLEYYKKLPIHSMMLAPLHVQENVLGVIGMARHSAGRNYTPDDLTFLQDIADRSALSMLNAQYYVELKQELAERKRLEHELQEERDFALQIINNLGQGLTVTDSTGHFQLVNPAYAHLIGYEPDELIGKEPSSVTLSESLSVLEHARLDRWNGIASTYESQIRHKNGTIIPVLITGTPRLKDGNYAGSITSITDLSEIRWAQEERERLITELSAKNAELEQFTYTVSHDLKSPLVTINGFLGYLEQDAVSGNIERFRRDTKRINEAVQKMQRLLNELLELSRIGRMMNSPEEIPFNELVEEALSIVLGRLKERGVVVHTQPDMVSVYGDRPRLVEVLQNLIDNAAKYMGDQKSPRIEIGQKDEDERGLPIFFVRDNGMGIDFEHHERIFGLFNKLDAKSEGTGVGLALVKRIIEFHGGRIWIESETGKGSAFFFTLLTGPAA